MLGLGLDIYKKRYLSSGFSFSDSDAAAYYNLLVTLNGGDIDAQTIYGINLDTLKGGIDTFFVNAKANGYYTKLTRLFPFIGGTALTHAANAIGATGPELTYTGSPTHDSTGMVTNGTSQYASMGNNPTADVAGVYDYSFGIWMDSSNSKMAMGSRDSTGNGAATRWSTGQTIYAYVNNLTVTGTAPTEFTKPVIVSTTAQNSSKVYLDGSTFGTNTTFKTAVFPSTYSTKIAGWDNYGTGIIDLSAGSTMMSFIGDGLSDAEVSDFTTDIKTLNNTLGRGYTFSDSDAEAYWNALTVANGSPIDCPTIYGLTNAAVMEAIDDCFTLLKTDGTYTQVKGMWLFIGGSDNTHKIDAKTLVSGVGFVSSPTNNALGMVQTSGLQYLNTGESPSSLGCLDNDNHLSIFTTTTNDIVAAGDRSGTGQALWIRVTGGTTLEWASCANSQKLNYTSWTSDDLNKVIIGSRRSSTDSELYIDGTSVATSATTNTGVISTVPHNIGEVLSIASLGNVKASTVGLGLSDTQAATLTTALKNLNTTLGR